MKYVIPAVVLLAFMFSTGCAKNKKSASRSVNGSVSELNVAPVPPSEPGIAYTTTPDYSATPTYYAPPIASPVAPAPAGPFAYGSGVMSGTTYTIRPGDTLYGLARQAYGDGKQWQRIATANPGVSPSSLKIGQTIAVP